MTVGEAVGVGVEVGVGVGEGVVVAVGVGVTEGVKATDVCKACSVACGSIAGVLEATVGSWMSDEGINPHAAMPMDAAKTMMETVRLELV